MECGVLALIYLQISQGGCFCCHLLSFSSTTVAKTMQRKRKPSFLALVTGQTKDMLSCLPAGLYVHSPVYWPTSVQKPVVVGQCLINFLLCCHCSSIYLPIEWQTTMKNRIRKTLTQEMTSSSTAWNNPQSTLCTQIP